MITRLYAFGSNGSGQLGLGYVDDDPSTPQPCIFHPVHEDGVEDPAGATSIANDFIKKISAGGNHTLVLMRSGVVYVSGNINALAQDEVPMRNGTVCEFWPVKELLGMHVTDVAASWEASFFVVDGREVFVSGKGDKGELGLGDGVAHTSAAKLVFEVKSAGQDDRIISVCAGMTHVVMLLSSGDVYGWGACRKGQLGDKLRSKKISWSPARLRTSLRATQIAVGREYTFMYGDDGDSMFLGENKTSDQFPVRKGFQAASVLSGWSTIYVLLNGKVTCFGRNNRGQMPPSQLPLLKMLSVGSEHALARTTDDSVIAWGWGEHGNCGSPSDDRGNVAGRYNDVKLDLNSHEQITGLGAGCATSFVWTQEV